MKYNNFSGLPFEMQLLKGIKEGQYRLRIFNPYASSKVKSEIDAIRNRISNFDK